MINQIREWIEQTNQDYIHKRTSCSVLEDKFKGFHPSSFLQSSYFVVVPEIPKPDFPELREAGLGEFIDMPVDGITYLDTYYLSEDSANNYRIHFHELVHVVQ